MGPGKTGRPTTTTGKGRNMGGKADTKRVRPASTGSKSWKARALKRELYPLSLAARDRRVAWYAKGFAVSIIGYVLSPIDPVPDFVPVLGSIDELILVPAAITLLIKMIPREVVDECTEKARYHHNSMKGKHWAAASIVVLVWLAAMYLTIRLGCFVFLRWKGF